MITTICAGDWIQFQQIERGKLVTAQGRVKALPKFPAWLWVGDRIVADSDGEQSGDIIVLAHVSADATDRIARAIADATDRIARAIADATDRIARAIADADGNSRPGCVYITLAEAAKAAMAADGAE